MEHDNEFIIFTNVGTEGRTGHNYGNRWEGICLRWYHKRGSHLGRSSVQKLLEPASVVHIFWRTENESPFEYAGKATAIEVADTSPVETFGPSTWRMLAPASHWSRAQNRFHAASTARALFDRCS